MITGKDLIELGYAGAPWFKEVLAIANKPGFEINELRSLCESRLPAPFIPLKQEPVPYSVYLDSYDEYSQKNREQVIETMDLVMRTPTVIGGMLMPDACPAGPIGTIPVGGVVFTDNAIHPGMHSADICCSMMATNFGKISPKQVMEAAVSSTYFGPGSNPNIKGYIRSMAETYATNPFIQSLPFTSLSRRQIGTQGDGNHFIFVGVSENTGDTYVVTHHGSRGPGALLYKRGMQVAEKYRRKLSPETPKQNAWIPYDTKDGRDYYQALLAIKDWTRLNHLAISTLISDQILVFPKRILFNPHNFVFKNGTTFVHAKGATPLGLSDGMSDIRIIPMNMNEPILLTRIPESCGDPVRAFAPHGAGRNMSRTAYMKQVKGTPINQIVKEQTEGIDVRFFSGVPDISELPGAYKNAREIESQILKYNLATIVDRILPYGCMMAGQI